MSRLVFLFILATLIQSAARAADPFPEFTGDNLYLSGVAPEPWQGLKDFIQKTHANSQQSYYVVVVNSTGKGARATPDYTGRLYQQWKRTSAVRNLPLDPNRSVLIVLGIQNRQLSVNAGTVLQQKYGLQGQAIDRRIVQRTFIPHARAGNHAEGMEELIRGIESWVSEIDSREARQRQQSLARIAKMEQDATSTLASARSLASQIDTEINDWNLSTAVGDNARDRLTSVQARLKTLERETPQSPVNRLAEARKAIRALRTIRDELTDFAERQHAALAVLKEFEADALTLENRLQELSEQAHATGNKGQTLDQLRVQAAGIETMADDEPRQAVIESQTLLAKLTVLRREAENIPQDHLRLESALAELETTTAAWEDQYKRMEELGLDPRRWDARKSQIAKAVNNIDSTKETHYAAAVRSADTAIESIRDVTGEMKAAADSHIHMTRTVPAIVLSCIVAAIALVLGFLRWLHVKLKADVLAQKSEFRTKAVMLSDRIDQVRERHRHLPWKDKDYVEQMTGKTLDLYDEIQSTLESLRTQWLDVMEVWETAEKEIRSESWFGRARLRKAGELIESASVDDLAESLKTDCEAAIEHLANAHEECAVADSALRSAEAEVAQQLQKHADTKLSTRCYSEQLETVITDREQVAALRVSDPISATSLYTQIHDHVATVKQWSARVIELNDNLNEVTEMHTAQVGRKHELAAEGCSFAEAETNPDASLERSESLQTQTFESLNLGDADAAAVHLNDAANAVRQAEEQLTQLTTARSYCNEAEDRLSAMCDQIAEQVTAAENAPAQLEQQFLPALWSDVHEAVELGRQEINNCRDSLTEAITLSDSENQKYLFAARTFRHAELRLNAARQSLAAVGLRLNDLVQLRDQVTTEHKALKQHETRVDRLLSTNVADRPAANRKFQQAHEALGMFDTVDPLNADWPLLREHMQNAARLLAASEELARADIQLKAQANREIDDADREIKEARRFYREGCSADTTVAAYKLSEAKSALKRQQYVEAIRLADQSESSARGELATAKAAANRVRRDRERSRRAREARRRRSSLVDSTFLLTAFGSSGNSSSRSSFGGFGSRSGSSSGRSTFGSSSGSVSSSSFSSGTSSSSFDSGISTSSW